MTTPCTTNGTKGIMANVQFAMKTIPLTQGKVAIVDDEDFDRVSQKKWYAQHNKNTFYAMTRNGKNGGHELMHRRIMNPPKGLEVDHINHDGLDNRRFNLRICTREQNARNSIRKKTNTSGFTGVSLSKRETKRKGVPVWESYIRYKGKRIFLGFCLDKNAAKESYLNAAQKYFGEFSSSDLRSLK